MPPDRELGMPEKRSPIFRASAAAMFRPVKARNPRLARVGRVPGRDGERFWPLKKVKQTETFNTPLRPRRRLLACEAREC